MIVSLSVFLLAPLALASTLLGAAAALRFLRKGPAPARLLVFAELALWGLFAAGFAVELNEHLGYRDWMHSYWSAGVPLSGLFLASGVLLCRTRPTDAECAFGRARRSGALDFVLMVIVLGCMPLVLPDPHPTGRNLGEPLRRTWELALWGFGGARPEALEGTEYLPREVTVPMGTTLVAAWLTIAFALLAILGRLIAAQRRRLAAWLVAPPLVVVLCWSGLLHVPNPWSDSMAEGIWTSDHALMKSFGPVLLAALLLALVLLCPSLPLFRTSSRDSRPAPRAGARPRD